MPNNKILIGVGSLILLIIGTILFLALNGEEEVVVKDVWDEDWEEEREVAVTEPEEAQVSEGWESSIIRDGFYSSGDFNIAIDSDNKLHVVYEGIEDNNVNYLYQTGEGYEKEVIIEQDFMGRYMDSHPDIAVGSDDTIRVVFLQEKDDVGEIVYALRNNGVWEMKTVSSGSLVGDADSSIALDKDDSVHIVYWGPIVISGKRGFNYLTNESGEWERKETNYGKGTTLSLDLDNEGNPHVMQTTRKENGRVWSGNLFYSFLEREEWNLKEVEENIVRPEGGEILLDSNGNPKIVYKKSIKDEYDYYYETPIGASLKNGEWIINPIEAEEIRDWGSAVIDENDQIHIVYSYYGYGSSGYGRYRWEGINYIQGQGEKWREEIVKDTAKMEGDLEESIEGIDLAIDNAGKTHIVYLLKDSSGEEDVYTLGHLWKK